MCNPNLPLHQGYTSKPIRKNFLESSTTRAQDIMLFSLLIIAKVDLHKNTAKLTKKRNFARILLFLIFTFLALYFFALIVKKYAKQTVFCLFSMNFLYRLANNRNFIVATISRFLIFAHIFLTFCPHWLACNGTTKLAYFHFLSSL